MLARWLDTSEIAMKTSTVLKRDIRELRGKVKIDDQYDYKSLR